MKKVALLLLSVFLIVSCKFDIATNILEGIDSNPFINKEVISETSDDIIHFLIFSDLHINREKEDWGTKERTEELKEHLRDNKTSSDPYDLIISLGDIEDAGNIKAQELLDFLSFIDENEITMLTTMANHELQLFYPRSDWDKLYKSYGIYGTLGCYKYGELSLYTLDSSKRVYGRDQLNYLEEALKSDDSKYKIFLTHMNTYSGGTFDLSLVLFGSADIIERNKIYSLMHDYKVGMIFNGHFHRNTIITKHSDVITEYNLSTAHSYPAFNIPGSLYDCHLDTSTGEIKINILEYDKNGTLNMIKEDRFQL